MTEIFLKLVNMSITAGWIILAVLFARIFLKKAPKWISCLLWGIVALRLMIPFAVESPLSMIPSAEFIPADLATTSAPAVHSGITVVNSTINPMMTQKVIESGNIWSDVLPALSVIWLVGMAGILAYGLVSYLSLWRKVCACIRVCPQVYICDDIPSPFILGFFRPKIFMPSGLSAQTMEYVLLHENVHLRRKDHWWKPLGYCLLAVYWFNPLLWVGYILLCRDIERSCDEKVISSMSTAEKQGYSMALVSCSTHRRMVAVCPVAFGEVSVKTRIKAIVDYRKPTSWIVLFSVILCVAISVCFLTNPETCLHIYADEIVVDATCSQMGVASHTCRLCQYQYTEPLQMCAHTYAEGTILQDATCTADGVMEVQCVICGAKEQEKVEKLPHTHGELFDVKEATCVATGSASTVCQICHVAYEAVLPVCADAHCYEETVLKASTCAENGEGILTCVNCQDTRTVIYELAAHDPTGHTHSDGTCVTKGYDAWYCRQCGYNHVEYTTVGTHAFRSGKCIYCSMKQPNNQGGYDFMGNSEPYNYGEITGPIIWDIAGSIRPKP